MALKPKMPNLKDFDWKQFLLQRGEWIGLAVVLAIVIPIFGKGLIKTFTAKSPNGEAAHFKALTSEAEDKIRKSKPPADADQKPAEFFEQLQVSAVDPGP